MKVWEEYIPRVKTIHDLMDVKMFVENHGNLGKVKEEVIRKYKEMFYTLFGKDD